MNNLIAAKPQNHMVWTDDQVVFVSGPGPHNDNSHAGWVDMTIRYPIHWIRINPMAISRVRQPATAAVRGEAYFDIIGLDNSRKNHSCAVFLETMTNPVFEANASKCVSPWPPGTK